MQVAPLRAPSIHLAAGAQGGDVALDDGGIQLEERLLARRCQKGIDLADPAPNQVLVSLRSA